MPARPDDLRSHDLLTPDAAELPEFRLLLERGAQRAKCLDAKLAVDDPAVLHAALPRDSALVCCRSSCAARDSPPGG